MRLNHAQFVADILAEGDRGDFMVLDPLTSTGRTIHGHFTYETNDGLGIDLRVPMMRIARRDVEMVPNGTVVWVTSEIHGLVKSKHEVVRSMYDDSATINLELLALA